MTDNHRGRDADTAVPAGTRVHVMPSSGGGAGFVAEDLGPLPPNAVVTLDPSTTIRPRRFAIALDDGSLVFLDADEFNAESDE